MARRVGEWARQQVDELRFLLHVLHLGRGGRHCKEEVLLMIPEVLFTGSLFGDTKKREKIR